MWSVSPSPGICKLLALVLLFAFWCHIQDCSEALIYSAIEPDNMRCRQRFVLSLDRKWHSATVPNNILFIFLLLLECVKYCKKMLILYLLGIWGPSPEQIFYSHFQESRHGSPCVSSRYSIHYTFMREPIKIWQLWRRTSDGLNISYKAVAILHHSIWSSGIAHGHLLATTEYIRLPGGRLRLNGPADHQ